MPKGFVITGTIIMSFVASSVQTLFCNTNKQVDSTGKNCESYGVSEQNKGSLLTRFCFGYEDYDFFTVMFKSLIFTVLNTFLDFLLCWFLVLKWDDSAIFPSLFFLF